MKVSKKINLKLTPLAIAPIVVGVPSGEIQATSRKEPLILSWKK